MSKRELELQVTSVLRRGAPNHESLLRSLFRTVSEIALFSALATGCNGAATQLDDQPAGGMAAPLPAAGDSGPALSPASGSPAAPPTMPLTMPSGGGAGMAPPAGGTGAITPTTPPPKLAPPIAPICTPEGEVDPNAGIQPAGDYWMLPPDPAEWRRQFPTRRDLIAYLGEIDTQQEAALLVVYEFYKIPCDSFANGNIAEQVDGYEVVAVRDLGSCPVVRDRFRLWVGNDGSMHELERLDSTPMGEPCITEGRRPRGLLAMDGDGGASALGAHFARMAYLEAASVDAFEILARELARLGAPRALYERAVRAAQDEVVHARLASSMAERFGARPSAPRLCRSPAADLASFALENAVEGCVFETFAALRATHQARAAQDAAVRSMMQRVARDETAHAALAFDIAAWAEPRLDASGRRAVAAARGQAAQRLARSLASEVPGALVRVAGVPAPAQANALFELAAPVLWGGARGRRSLAA